MNKVSAEHIEKLVASLTFKFARVSDTTVTGCWAFLPNGFQVGYGESACVDPKEYKQDDGEKYAKERCIQVATNELWKLEGYMLKMTGHVSGEVSEKTCKSVTESMTFGMAVSALKEGKKVAREGWNGKGMYLRKVNPYTDKKYPITEVEPTDGTLLPWVGMKTADNSFVPWLASQTDMLSEDWMVV